jgi:UTP-glucose-1-phosphate uridylyltransferase
MEDYFDNHVELEHKLEAEGKDDLERQKKFNH